VGMDCNGIRPSGARGCFLANDAALGAHVIQEYCVRLACEPHRMYDGICP